MPGAIDRKTLDESSRRARRAIAAAPVTYAPPAVYPGRVPLGGERVVLEPLDPRRHGEALYAVGHADDAARKLWAYLPYGPFADAPAMHAWLRGCAASPDPVFLALRARDSGEVMGMASFLEIRPLIGVVEIGHIWFAPPYQRDARTGEALFVMMRHVLDELAYRRLEWKCNALNEASRRAALRLGFRFEGEFLNHNVVKGHNRDTAWYSIIDSEWPSVRENFERWLSPDNFAADGSQRVSLSELNRALW